MQRLLKRLDDLAGISVREPKALWLERAAFVCLVLVALTAPHSIAASQTAWILGTILWIARALLKPRRGFVATGLFLPFLIYLLWSVVSAVFSYAPDISIDKLRTVLLLLVYFFTINVARTKRAVAFLAFALIFSTMVNVVWTPIERVIGRGVEVHRLAPNSPLKTAGIREGDTLLAADGKTIRRPEDLARGLALKGSASVRIYRPDYYFVYVVEASDMLDAGTAAGKLGIGEWKRSRNWRSSGFYGHYATYAEVLQLTASLAFGLFIALAFGRRIEKQAPGSGEEAGGRGSARMALRLLTSPWTLLLCALLMALALLLTVTRASQAAFLVSAFLIVAFGAGRKVFLIFAAVAIPLALGGLLFLQQSRQIGFFDAADASTTWRQTVYREGFELWTDNPRNFILGVGMDSIKRYKEEWHLFDDGRLPTGHFHSTPLQLLVERGLPALLIWLWILLIYFRMFLRELFPLRNGRTDDAGSDRGPVERGILLGCFGASAGFFASGLVHYNLGDGEVAMIFFLLMAFAVRLVRGGEAEPSDETA